MALPIIGNAYYLEQSCTTHFRSRFIDKVWDSNEKF